MQPAEPVVKRIIRVSRRKLSVTGRSSSRAIGRFTFHSLLGFSFDQSLHSSSPPPQRLFPSLLSSAGTFSPFTYETCGPQALSSDSSLSQHRWRSVDHHGAPSVVHRGVTSIRTKTSEQGRMPSTVPIGNRTLSHTKEFEWHAGGGVKTYMEASMKIGVDNFRQRHEGLDGVKRRHAKIDSLHGGLPFSHGANDHHDLFVREPRSNAQDFSKTSDGIPESMKVAVKRNRVPHNQPFRGAGQGSITNVGGDRGFVSGHVQFPYHYSDYGLSEKSLSDTKIQMHGVGFRMRCGHHIHHPMKSPTHRSSQPCHTDRNPNFHAIQAEDETCYHKCNQVLHQARTTRMGESGQRQMESTVTPLTTR